ncbi:phosphoribosyltransferase family protein [Gordonia sp. CPCC 205515]|uniref:phosphoribosyltransferase family protein n=1 Tax=Gordonia sp. CPCC 205515 TaxID=3140791 RepID=UPI003AF3A802
MTETSTVPAAGAVPTQSWVTTTFGAEVQDRPDSSTGHSVTDLVVLGLRRNRRRAHLLVSTVLGKHIPVSPRVVRRAADDLGDAVLDTLGPDAAGCAVVVGFAETATGLGHCVAERIGAQTYLHSTRRRRPGAEVHGTFEEGHSHATTHLLQPSSPDLLAGSGPLVLVDDEISTGKTAVEAVAALHRIHPRSHYVIAALVDMRDETHLAATADAAASLGVRIDHVSLAHGRVTLPHSLIDDVCALAAPDLNPVAGVRGQSRVEQVAWPDDVPDGGRHGYLYSEAAQFHHAVDDVARVARSVVDTDRPLVVVGHEEFMYLPLCVAERLERDGLDVRYQTTTRSPAHVRDVDGYPLRRGFEFTAPESDPDARRYLYNVGAPDGPPAQVLFVADSPADTAELRAPGGLLDVLGAAGHDVTVLVVPETAQSVIATSRGNR